MSATYPTVEIDPVASAAMTGKQDASTAATDAELATHAAAKAVHGIANTDKVPRLDETHSNALGTSFTLTNPAITPVLTGQFTPRSSEVLVDVDISHVMLGALGAWANWHLYYGQGNPAVLTPVHQNDALTSGVTHVGLGAQAQLNGGRAAAIKLTGLTPDQPVKYEISATITGGARPIPTLAQGPYALDVSDVDTNRGASWLAVRHAGTGALEIFRCNRSGKYDERSIGSLTLPSNSFSRAAISPDGTRALSTNELDHSVTIATVNRDTDAVAALAGGTGGAGRFVVPGTTPFPLGVTADNTFAWIVTAGTKALVRCTLASGVMGTPVDLGVSGSAAWADAALAPAGDFVYALVAITGGVTSRIVKVRTSDQTVVSSLVVTNAWCLAVAPDGANLYVGMVGDSAGNPAAPYAVRKVRTSDMTQVGSDGSVGSNRPVAIEALPDGRGLIMVCDTTGGAARQVQHMLTGTSPSSTYVEWLNQLSPQATPRAAGDVAIDDWGDVFISNQTDNTVNHWFGGKIVLDPTNGFYNGLARLRVVGAT